MFACFDLIAREFAQRARKIVKLATLIFQPFISALSVEDVSARQRMEAVLLLNCIM